MNQKLIKKKTQSAWEKTLFILILFAHLETEGISFFIVLKFFLKFYNFTLKRYEFKNLVKVYKDK